ncbi:conserved membrane hypothetical protein [Marinoscillum sp. 108]|nr:conserved membrane hypothetical protein [Marinoscillum sp. 108]
MPSEMETCINCNQESDGNYCPNCGQKLHLKKLTIRYISSEFTDRWLGLDTKFTRSAWGLFLHPEQVITAYLNRNNVRYIGPLGYYIVMTALMLIAFELLGLEVADFIKSTNENLGLPQGSGSERQLALQENISGWISRNFRFASAFLIPFLTVGVQWLYRKKRSFLENLVLITYLQTHTIWFLIVGLLAFKWTGFWVSQYMTLVSLIYFCWALGRFDDGKITFRKFFKALLTWIVSYLLFIFTILLVAILIVVLVGEI